MTTTADYKAMITTEIRVPLSQIPDEGVGKIIGNNGCNLKIIEYNSNTRCSWDKKNLSVYIHGEPKAAKKAYAIIMAQISKFAGANGATTEAMVNVLGKEYVDGVHFCELTDEAVTSDDKVQGEDEVHSEGDEAKPAVFVIHPITMTYEEKQRGRIIASELWRSAQFVTWDFKDNVIQDASMALRRQLHQLSRDEGKYLKLEMDIGKVIFLENDEKNLPLQGAKFAISEFRHLRFNKEITSSFRKEWKRSWVTRLQGMLPMLGYEKDGCTTKHVKIYHTAQNEDGKCSEVTWSADILEGRRRGDAKPGTLEFVKARVRGDNSFSVTVYGPATAFDFRFSIITNTRESVERNRDIETRVRWAYRYSLRRGLLVNHPYENRHGYTPLVNLKARLIHETIWKRGEIKVTINEIQDGHDNTLEVKIQSNLLKRYTREEPGEVPLSDIIEAVRDFLEAAEEINGELNLLTAELPSKKFPTHTAVAKNNMEIFFLPSPSATQSNYEALGASIHSEHVAVRPDKTLSSKIRVPHNSMFESASTARGSKPASHLSFSNNFGDNTSKKRLLLTLGSPLTGTDFGGQRKRESGSPTLRQSPIIGNIGVEAFWKTQTAEMIDEFKTPALTPTKEGLRGSSPTVERVLFKAKTKQASEPKFVPETTISPPSSNCSVTAKKASRNTAHRKQDPIEGLSDSLPPHLRPVVKSPRPSARTLDIYRSLSSPDHSSSVKQVSPSSNNFSDRFFDLLDSATDGSSPHAGVLTPKKAVSPRSGKIMIDFFGSVGSLKGGDAEDLMLWSPDNDAFSYFHESDSVDIDLGEGVSLLLD